MSLPEAQDCIDHASGILFRVNEEGEDFILHLPVDIVFTIEEKYN